MVLNLHGLYGNARNTNYQLLAGLYSENCIISPQIDYAETSPVEILDELKEYKEIDYVVGNSFGGFFAYMLSNMHHMPCLLVNPCIPPQRYITSLVKGYAFTDELIWLMGKYPHNSYLVYIILGMEDHVLSPANTEQIMNAARLWKIHGGHSFSGNEQFGAVFIKAVEEVERLGGKGL